jgi:bifunctional non-homologous end joining protein LigD
MLQRHGEIPFTCLVFDLLRLEGRDLTREQYRERRQILAALGIDGPRRRVPEAFEDGPALWEAVCEYELEGVVGKRLHDRYFSGDRPG